MSIIEEYIFKLFVLLSILYLNWRVSKHDKEYFKAKKKALAEGK